MQPTILLVGSNEDYRWIGMHAALREWGGASAIVTVRGAIEAKQTVVTQHVDIIVVSADMSDRPLVSLVRNLRAARPDATIFVIGSAAGLDHDSLCLLALLVDGYFVWEDLRLGAVQDSLSVVLEVGVVVWSRLALATLLDPAARLRARNAGRALTILEQSVLHKLATGLTQRQIATAEHVSEPAVKRTIAALRKKFDVPTTCALCAQAALQGFTG